MYGGDRSRKENLVEYGFRLPSAMDNRPLTFEEFEELQNQVIFVSATPSDYELNKSEGIIVEQIIRPTGLLDPKIEIKSTENQIDDVLNEVQKIVEKKERVLITTLTKKMAEELVTFLNKVNVKSKYIHSDIDTIERVEILNELRIGSFDVLVGVNLLREGLDLPEVSLVIILDADKEGFLRSKRSLIQTIGRAARNINGKAIMYADKETDSIKSTLKTTIERRKKQKEYNKLNNITPTQIKKNIMTTFETKDNVEENNDKNITKIINIDHNISADKRKKIITNLRKDMVKAAKELDFIEAARLRDLITSYKKSG
jgi:excinuclease ABC subunit B